MRRDRKMISVLKETYEKLDFVKLLSQEESWDKFFSNFVMPTLGKEIANGAVDHLLSEHEGNLQKVKSLVAQFGGVDQK